jgi:hypothetical protein
MVVNRNNLGRIKELSYELHDKWFSVDDIVYDEIGGEFRLPYGEEKDCLDHCLVVSGVTGVHLVDTEHVGLYDIYGVSVDLKSHEIHVEGCIPIEIVLTISDDFEMSLAAKSGPPWGD